MNGQPEGDNREEVFTLETGLSRRRNAFQEVNLTLYQAGLRKQGFGPFPRILSILSFGLLPSQVKYVGEGIEADVEFLIRNEFGVNEREYFSLEISVTGDLNGSGGTTLLNRLRGVNDQYPIRNSTYKRLINPL